MFSKSKFLAPFGPDTRFYRGNLHGHSTHSDGNYSPETVAQIYQNLGYDFTCLSDHLWSDPRFGAKTVLDASRLNTSRFITIPSAELHCLGKKYDNDGLWHVIANGLPLDFEVASHTETAAELVARAAAAGAYVTLAHPEWYSMTMDEAMGVSHAHGVEIYNHSCVLGSTRGGGFAIADYLLQEGKKLTLTATDDSHFQIEDGGGGWVMVAADTLSADAIVAALIAGQFYSSTGPDIHRVQFADGILQIACSPAHSITLVGAGHVAKFVTATKGNGTKGNGTKGGGEVGDKGAGANGSSESGGEALTRADFDMQGFASDWFRISIRDEAGRMAWSNPYWLADLV